MFYVLVVGQVALDNSPLRNDPMVFFKRVGSRHIHKEIKLQEGMNRIDNILCKLDQKLGD